MVDSCETESFLCAPVWVGFLAPRRSCLTRRKLGPRMRAPIPVSAIIVVDRTSLALAKKRSSTQRSPAWPFFDPAPRKSTKSGTIMPQRDVAIIGDSFPSRLEAHLYAEQRDRHLDLDRDQANVRWYGQGGLSLDKLHRIEFRLLRDFQNVAILHIGSNDLCSVSPMAFMAKLRNETIPWLRSLGCRVVVLSQIFHRQPGHYTKNLNLEAYNRRVDDTNAAMAELKMDNVIYWSHESVLHRGSVTAIWHKDGVHLNSKGQDLFARSLRGALITTLRAIDR